MKDYYKILEVDPQASAEVIHNAYRALVKKYHPDTYHIHSRRGAVEHHMKTINEAYDVLSNPQKRQRYDAEYQHAQNTKPFSHQWRHLGQGTQKIASWFFGIILVYLVFRTLGQLWVVFPLLKWLVLGLVIYLGYRYFNRR